MLPTTGSCWQGRALHRAARGGERGGSVDAPFEASHPHRVLVVEDSRYWQQVLLELLAEFDVAPDLASDGEAGAEALSDRLPDLLITDLNLPLRLGWSVIDILHRRHGRTVPVILQTDAGADPAVQVRATGLGVILIAKADLRAELPRTLTQLGLSRRC